MLHIKVEFLFLENWMCCTPCMPQYELLSTADESLLAATARDNPNKD